MQLTIEAPTIITTKQAPRIPLSLITVRQAEPTPVQSFVAGHLTAASVLSLSVVILSALCYVGIEFQVKELLTTDLLNNPAQSSCILFFILGLVTLFQSRFHADDSTEQRTLIIACFGSTVISLIVLAKYLFNFPIDIDSLICGPLPPVTEPCAQRMAMATAVNFAILGVAYSLISANDSDRVKIGQLLIVIPFATALVTIVGYAFEATGLYGYAKTPMSTRAAAMFVILVLAMTFSRPTKGYMTLLTSDTAGSVLLRRLLPIALVGPLVVGMICLFGNKLLNYGADVETALMATAMGLLFTVGILLTGVKVRELDEKRTAVENQVKQTYADLQTRVAELALVNTKLETVSEQTQQSRDQALEASRLKSQFVAKMSHEIRTPMNGVLGIVEALLRTDIGEREREYVRVIKDAGQSFLALISDILDFSRIEEGTLVIENGPVEPLRLVEGVCELLAPQTHAKGLKLYSYIDPRLPSSLVGDEARLRQILLNLGGNAIKFTERGKITIRAMMEELSGREMFVSFSVTDSGIGLTEETHKRLFQPFVQADGTINRKYGGTGLGLSISKRLVELMGGEIGADGKEGTGSTFWFVVPLGRARRTPPLPSAPKEVTNTRLLVVDDDEQAREAIKAYLVSFGFMNVTTTSHVDALAKMSEAHENGNEFRVVIVDSGTAGISAFELARKVRTDSRFQVARLILITAYDGMEKADAHPGGFVCTVRRPIRRMQLLQSVVSTLTGERESITLRVFSPTDPSGSLPTLTRMVAFGQRADESQRDSARFEIAEERVKPFSGLALVVDDTPINQQVACILLADLGLICDVASNGKEAVKAYESRTYDIILMDLQMPEMDGMEATRQIRKLETRTGRHIPIIAVTAHALEGSRDACLSSGMDDYLSKPVQPDALQATLSRFLHRGSTSPSDAEKGQA